MHDQPYAAAFVVKTIMEANGLVEGYSYWTFSDIFEENYFPSTPFHGGFGLLNIHGIAKPAYRAFELLHKLGYELLQIEGEHATVDVWAVRGTHSVTLMLTNFALPRHEIAVETVQLEMRSIVAPAYGEIRRIDADHANPRRRWEELGSPDYLGAVAVENLMEYSTCNAEPCDYGFHEGKITCTVTLAALSVTTVTFHFQARDVG
jgi:xylan 1,4-beta-xylosidase